MLLRCATDVRLVADAAFCTLWSDARLTDADTHMADGPHQGVGGGGTCTDALAALFRAIRDVLPARSDVVGRGAPDEIGAFDGEPVAWSPIDVEFSDEDFAVTHLAVARIAINFLAHDHIGARRDATSTR